MTTTNANKPILKVFALETPTLKENSGSGAASVMGVLDQADDVIFPGFWTPLLADFLKNGFVAQGHQWDSPSIGYPTFAEERGNELYVEWGFHTTPEAQTVRTVAKERIDNGLSMGLSVGFLCADIGVQYFKNGAALLAYAEKNGYSMRLFDVDGISAHDAPCRGLTKGKKLYEFSPVSAPCNTLAVAEMVKGESIVMPSPSSSQSKTSLLKLSTQIKSPKSAPITPAADMVTLKGEALGDVEMDASMSALRTVNSALMGAIYQTLNFPGLEITSLDELLSPLPAAFDEARDLSMTILRALLANVDIESLREDDDFYDWMYYYGAPPGEQAVLTFSQKAARLETDAAAFLTLATRRQEVRVKERRKLSASTREKMQAIKDSLAAHCDALGTLLAESEAITEAATMDTEKGVNAPADDPVVVSTVLADDPAALPTTSKALARQNADRLLREIQLSALTWESVPA